MATIDSLAQINQQGLKTASFVEIKEALSNRYREIFGSDIDIDDTTADGIFINDLSLIINNILRVMDDMYANLDIRTASGQYLDVLCALSNITRKQPTKSNTILTVAYIGTADKTMTPEELTFIDVSGLEWQSPTPITFYAVPEGSDPVNYNVYVECKSYGMIAAPAGSITRMIELSSAYFESIDQPNDAIVGTDEESDSELRTRQQASGAGSGITVKSALQARLLALPDIEDVAVIDNPLDTIIIVADTVVMTEHSVYPIIRVTDRLLNDLSKVDKEQIGSVIYNALTPGIRTVLPVPTTAAKFYGTTQQYEYVDTINGVASSSLQRQFILWKVAKPYPDYTKSTPDPSLSITLHTLPYFSTDNIESIANQLISWLNSISIGTVISNSDVQLKTLQVDPQFRGSATYYLSESDITGLCYESTTAKNYLTYYKYSTFSYVTGTGTVTITLS